MPPHVRGPDIGVVCSGTPLGSPADLEMAGNSENSQTDPGIVACTISRDIQNFDLLIEDMEACLGEAWGDLGFGDAPEFLGATLPGDLEFVVLAVDDDDESDLNPIDAIISAAKAKGLGVILIAENLSPTALHRLLRQGADEFIPYPLPENELAAAIERLRTPAPVQPVQAPAAPVVGRNGVVIATHGLAGGVGASAFTVNLAHELATLTKEDRPSVCILDLDLQFGSISTYLDLPRRDATFELLSDTSSMDDESFLGALQTAPNNVSVLTAPAEVLPLEFITPADVEALLEKACHRFDYVLLDLPTTVVQWTETVLNSAHIYFGVIALDMRSAQNVMRLKTALETENLPVEKLRFMLSRAPRLSDLSGRSRVKRLTESLGIGLDLLLPDGGRQVLEALDHGRPLAEVAAKNPLRKEIVKLAKSIHDHNLADPEAG